MDARFEISSIGSPDDDEDRPAEATIYFEGIPIFAVLSDGSTFWVLPVYTHGSKFKGDMPLDAFIEALQAAKENVSRLFD